MKTPSVEQQSEYPQNLVKMIQQETNRLYQQRQIELLEKNAERIAVLQGNVDQANQWVTDEQLNSLIHFLFHDRIRQSLYGKQKLLSTFNLCRPKITKAKVKEISPEESTLYTYPAELKVTLADYSLTIIFYCGEADFPDCRLRFEQDALYDLRKNIVGKYERVITRERIVAIRQFTSFDELLDALSTYLITNPHFGPYTFRAGLGLREI